jgi:hypothetical protein
MIVRSMISVPCSAYWLLVVEAVRLGVNYTHQGISLAFPVGKGHGPLNHMHTLVPRVLPLYVTPFSEKPNSTYEPDQPRLTLPRLRGT